MMQGRLHPKYTLFIPCREEFYNKSCTRRVVQEGLYQKIAQMKYRTRKFWYEIAHRNTPKLLQSVSPK
jgi:hypothetical protein